MVTTRKAIPTEYNGVRFDSKSEAVFIRLLESCAGVRSWSTSHPINFCGHPWDFCVWLQWRFPFQVDDKKIFSPLVPVRPVLIEYKPSEPTETYIRNLKNKIKKSNDAFAMCLITGSAFSDRPCFLGMNLKTKAKWVLAESLLAGLSHEQVDESEFYPLNNSSCIEAAKNHRFDLK